MSDPLHTRRTISKRGVATYRAIAARLASSLHPPILIAGHIADDEGGFSTLEAADSTLDGINFRTDDPKGLVALLGRVKDQWDQPALISMKEDPDHWALKASFAKTIGTGFREIWREAPFESPAAAGAPKEPGQLDNLMKMRFGKAGSRIGFTALHCGIHEISGKCNIHIDETGFMLQMPRGVSVTPDFYAHIVNELKWKTDFRDWAVGLADDRTVKAVIREVVRRVSLNFINSANGYAGLEKKINHTRWGLNLDSAITIGKILAPTGVTVDVYDNDSLKVQVTGSALDGDLSVTVTVGGTW